MILSITAEDLRAMALADAEIEAAGYAPEIEAVSEWLDALALAEMCGAERERLRVRSYYQKNRAATLQKVKEYQARNKEKIAAKKKQYREAHRAEINRRARERYYKKWRAEHETKS